MECDSGIELGDGKENACLLEDEDSVRRSTKKKKDSHPPLGGGVASGFISSPLRDTLGDTHSGSSYKDTLIGEILGAYAQALFGSAMDADDLSSDDEDDILVEGEVCIKISREIKHRIRAPWCTSFIVKVFGCFVGYLFLVNKLKSIWSPFGSMSCVDLGLGFFLVKFALREDFDKVLRGGP